MKKVAIPVYSQAEYDMVMAEIKRLEIPLEKGMASVDVFREEYVFHNKLLEED